MLWIWLEVQGLKTPYIWLGIQHTGETGYWVWVAKLEDETRRCPWKLLCVQAPFYSYKGISSSSSRLIKASPHWSHSLQQASSWWLRQVRKWWWIQHQQLLQWPLSHSCKIPTSTCKRHIQRTKKKRNTIKQDIIVIPKLIYYGSFHHCLPRSAGTDSCFKSSLQKHEEKRTLRTLCICDVKGQGQGGVCH